MGESRVTDGWLVVAVTAALFVLAASASADHGSFDPPGPELLPPGETTTEVQPHPVKRCRRASIRCVKRLERHLKREWRRHDRACDHRAVVYFSYLEITRGLRRDLAGSRPAIVRDRRWMTFLITTFSNRYRAAFRRYAKGKAVPDAWRIAFEAYDAGDANAGQDVLLFSNAHVQRDLPFALEEMGLATRDGRSRKPDHDAVNQINREVFDPIQDYIAEHYDPSFEAIDAKPSPLDETGTLTLVESWRENAWRFAERLLAAESESERYEVVLEIENNSRLWAEMIASGGMPGHRAARDAYCRKHHEHGR